MTNESFERITATIDKILTKIIVQDSANTRVGGVSFTALQKQFLSNLAINNDSEQMVLRKILQGILNEDLVTVITPTKQDALPVATDGFVSIEKYNELNQRYNQLATDYQEIFSKAGSDSVVVISKEEHLLLTQSVKVSDQITDDAIRSIIEIVTDNDDDDEAFDEIKAFLNVESDGE
jgi:hypothetical protein